ncbi:MAG: hypothetical protein HRU48_23465, partial [Vibrio sp.]|uniref:hypothetical protein n=1 Tax=Vibrio sp. TaxID=678 RepID=UPI001ECE22B6
MATTTTVTGPIKNIENSALAGKYIRFTLLTSGTESTTGDLVASSTKSYLLDANGDFSADLWVNGESGISSVYRIEVPGDDKTYQVIIPTSSAGSTISVDELLQFHQVDPDYQPDPNILDEAKAYTDSELNAFAADPSSKASLDPAEWRSDLGLSLNDTPEFNGVDIDGGNLTLDPDGDVRFVATSPSGGVLDLQMDDG